MLSSTELDVRRAKREVSSMVRRGGGLPSVGVVTYRVGQVVRHSREKWRGVIVGWDYCAVVGGAVRYSVLADAGDASLSTRRPLGLVVREWEGDLSPVVADDDARGGTTAGLLLGRVRNPLLGQFFVGFDGGRYYVPNDIIGYMYPLDRQGGTVADGGEEESRGAAEDEDDEHYHYEEDDDLLSSRGSIDSVTWLPSVYDHPSPRGGVTLVDDENICADEGGGASSSETFPLFPLGVYVPGDEAILNIFEPRYRRMIDDITVNNGTGRFVVTACHPTEGGKFASVGTLFEMVAGRVCDVTGIVVCNFRVAGRINLRRVLNPEDWATGDTYLMVEGTAVVENRDVAHRDSSDDDPPAVVGAVEKAPWKVLAESIRDLRGLQRELDEEMFTSAPVDVSGVEDGDVDAFWGFVRHWQTYSQCRQAIVQDEMQWGFRMTLVEFVGGDDIGDDGAESSSSSSSVNIRDLSPELRLELMDFERCVNAASERLLWECTLSIQRILEAEDHEERSKLMMLLVDAERRRLAAKKASKEIIFGGSAVTFPSSQEIGDETATQPPMSKVEEDNPR